MLVWEHLLARPSRHRGGLSSQLAASFIDAIDENRIPAGVRLPSSRMLADKLGLGRNTVISAVNSLVEQGYLVSKDRSGVVVAALGLPAPPSGSTAGTQQVDWVKRLPPSSATQAADVSPITLNLKYGQFDSSLFPLRHWRECERAALAVTEMAEWGRDVFDRDDVSLIDSLRHHILPRHGIWAGRDEILVTLGGQEGRYLVASLLCRPGTTTGVENPGMPDMNEIVSIMPTRKVHLPLDEEGAALSAELKQCDVAFLTPGHQCPTTRVMSQARRLALLELARRRDMIIVEDTYETETVAQKSSIPALKSFDLDGRVIHIGSLSKSIVPGLRIGFVVANTDVIEHLRGMRRLIHRHPPGNTQRALALFIDRGYYHSFMKRVGVELGKRAGALARSIEKWLPDVSYAHYPGSSTFWVRFPDDRDLVSICRRLRSRGIYVEAGDRFFFQKEQSNYIRMSVSQISEPDIENVVEALADCCRAEFEERLSG